MGESPIFDDKSVLKDIHPNIYDNSHQAPIYAPSPALIDWQSQANSEPPVVIITPLTDG